MAAVTYGLCRVNQLPPRTALQKGAVCDRAQSQGTSLSPQPPAQGGSLLGEPLLLHPLHSSAFSLSQSHAAIPHFALPGCAGAEGLGITPFSFTPLLTGLQSPVL